MARVRPGDPSVAVAYLRVSTEEQHLGPEAQRAAIERQADGSVTWTPDAKAVVDRELRRAKKAARAKKPARSSK
jgi:DNA invertase Pin-like site-specific DNA recombinase